MANTLAVLMVEDSESDANLIERALKKAGYDLEFERVETASQMRSALEWRSWNVVISDYNLPEFDGPGALALLQQYGRDIPFIVVSGAIGEERAAQLMKAGAHDYVLKGNTARLIPAVQRELAQAELMREHRNIEQRYQLLFEKMNDAVLIADDERRYVDVNPAALRLLGRTREQVIGHRIDEFATPAMADLTEPVWKGFVGAGEQDGTWQMSRPDGETREIEYTAVVNFMPGRHLSVARDITLRQRAIRALHQSEERFRLFVDGVRDYALIMLDTTGIIITWNSGAERIKGYRADEIIGQHFSRFYPADALRRNKPADALALTVREGVYREEGWRVRKDGSLFMAEVSITAVRDETGELRGFAKVTRDVTTRKQVEESLQREREFNRALLENLGEGVVACDAEGRLSMINRTARDWHGLGASPLPPAEWASQYNLYEADGTTAMSTERIPLVRAFEGERVRNAEMTIVANGRPPRTVLASGDALFDAAGRKLGAVVAMHDVTELNQSQRALERRAEEFSALFETAVSLTRALDLDAMLETIVSRARELLHADGGTILLLESASNELVVKVAQQANMVPGTRMRPGEGMAGRIAKTCQTLIVDDYRNWAGNAPAYAQTPVGSMVGAPMMFGGELIGVLTIEDNAESIRKFRPVDAQLLSLFAGQAASAVRDWRQRQETQRQLSYLRALRNIDVAISGSFELGLMLNVLLDEARTQLQVDAVDVLLLNPHTQRLEFKAGLGFRTAALQHTQLGLGQGYAGTAALERRTISVPDLRRAPGELARSPQLPGEDFASYYAAPIGALADFARNDEGFVAYFGTPLAAKGRVTGVLEIFHRSTLEPDVHWLNFLEALAGQTAIAIDSSKVFNDLQRSNSMLTLAYETTLEGWSKALDLRDKETEGHTLRTTAKALQLGHAADLPDDEIVYMRRGALLHDIGKMGVPDSILLKPGPLTEEEWVIMRKHPQYAFDLLSPIAYLRRSLDIPYCHHEKWDGTGYPRGLRDEQIPLAARIFAVIDVWDALSSDRPYRAAWPQAKVREHIRSLAGTHFDPKVVDIFLQIPE